MTDPLVSIVTPVLNRADSIGICLQSVADQTYSNVEHIVVDGGSSDGTLDILESCSAPNMRWTSGPDSGMYEAINRGLAMANGQILAYLNSDDAYFPWTVESAVKGLAYADVVFGDLVVVAPELREVRLLFYRPFSLRHYALVEAIAQPTVFWTREVYEQVGSFDESLSFVADCEYWIRAARAGKTVVHTGDVMAVQTDHSDTLRSKHGSQLADELASLRENWIRELGLQPLRFSIRSLVATRARVMRLRFYLVPGGKWSRFRAWLRSHALVPRGLFNYLLPGRARPEGVSMLDFDRFNKALNREAPSPSSE